MKTTTLIEKLNKLISVPAEETPLKKLRKTIRALKAKQKKLEAELKKTSGKHARARLSQKIRVLRAQRKKGAERYFSLKEDLKK